MVDIDDAMAALGAARPLFHSEADFQHALAWQLHEQHPNISIRLEYPTSHLPQRGHVDIWLGNGSECVAIELKYKTSALRATLAGQDFHLRNQSAQDIGRYDTLKDLQRLEQIIASLPHCVGFLVLLTNDSSYWTDTGRADCVDAAFRLHDGRTIKGQLAWDAAASLGTRKGRKADLLLSATYQSTWRDYSKSQGGRNGLFRYLLINVTSNP